MKFGLALITLLLPMLAWTQGVGVGGGGNTGGGVRLRALGCIEGNKGLFVRQLPSSGKEVTELRTCREGSFMTPEERAAYIYNPKTTCREGSYIMSTEYDHTTSSDVNVIRICKSNKWILKKAE